MIISQKNTFLKRIHNSIFLLVIHALRREKCPNTAFFSGTYFTVFGLNTEIYRANARIQSEYGKIRTRKNFKNLNKFCFDFPYIDISLRDKI